MGGTGVPVGLGIGLGVSVGGKGVAVAGGLGLGIIVGDADGTGVSAGTTAVKVGKGVRVGAAARFAVAWTPPQARVNSRQPLSTHSKIDLEAGGRETGIGKRRGDPQAELTCLRCWLGWLN